LAFRRSKHTHAHSFNGPLSVTTRVSRYQNGKTDQNFTGARDSEWQWHQLGRMQVCTSPQTDNSVSTPSVSFFTSRMPFLPPNKQRLCTEGVQNLGNKLQLVPLHATASTIPNPNIKRSNSQPNPDFFCINNAPFATRNKYTANDVSSLRMSVISCVLNADSGR